MKEFWLHINFFFFKQATMEEINRKTRSWTFWKSMLNFPSCTNTIKYDIRCLYMHLWEAGHLQIQIVILYCDTQ